jgi:hypothetical protein
MARITDGPSARSRRNAKPASATKAARPAGGRRAIDLYYWPTPNGWKITIMLEECTLPYAMIPLDISKGDQFKRECLAISPNKLG